MKYLMVVFFCLIGTASIGQRNSKYLIIDRKLKLPASFADTITNEQMNKGFFAVEKQSVDSLIAKMEFLSSKLRQVARYNIDESKWDIGSTVLTIKVVKFPFADRLNVALSTDIGHGHDREFYIVDAKLTNNDNARYLNKLIKYIQKSN